MTALDLDPSPLSLLKYNPDQPRVPAGNGRASGQWSGGGGVQVADARTNAIRALARMGAKVWNRVISRLKSNKPVDIHEPDYPLPKGKYGDEVNIPGLPKDIKGVDITDRKSRIQNYEIEMSKSEFENKLFQLGWKQTPSK